MDGPPAVSGDGAGTRVSPVGRETLARTSSACARVWKVIREPLLGRRAALGDSESAAVPAAASVAASEASAAASAVTHAASLASPAAALPLPSEMLAEALPSQGRGGASAARRGRGGAAGAGRAAARGRGRGRQTAAGRSRTPATATPDGISSSAVVPQQVEVPAAPHAARNVFRSRPRPASKRGPATGTALAAAAEGGPLVAPSAAADTQPVAPLLCTAVVPGSEDASWITGHPLFIKINQRGYPLPIGEQEILALRDFTPRAYGGTADIRFF